MIIDIYRCKPHLEAKGIYMEKIGGYTALSNAMSEVMTYDTMEYWYQEDIIKIFASTTDVPADLSTFGEVEVYDDIQP